MEEQPRIKSYYEGKQEIKQELRKWIDEHRTYIEVEAGIGVYRDHFSSNDLVAFLDSLK